jgi:hypothetical protein
LDEIRGCLLEEEISLEGRKLPLKIAERGFGTSRRATSAGGEDIVR